jgi:hypothetical protein
MRLLETIRDYHSCDFFPNDLVFQPAECGFGRSVPVGDLPGCVHADNGIKRGIKQQLKATGSTDYPSWLLAAHSSPADLTNAMMAHYTPATSCGGQTTAMQRSQRSARSFLKRGT